MQHHIEHPQMGVAFCKRLRKIFQSCRRPFVHQADIVVHGGTPQSGHHLVRVQQGSIFGRAGGAAGGAEGGVIKSLQGATYVL